MSNEQETITNSNESTNTETTEQENQETQQEAQGQENQVTTEQIQERRGMIQALNKDESELCMACLTSKYPTQEGTIRYKQQVT